MKPEVLWRLKGEARASYRDLTNPLSAACIACLVSALAGAGGLAAHAQQHEIHYKIDDLGVVGANPSQPGQPLVISNSGWIAGGAGVGAAVHAVLWRGDERFDIGDPGLGGNGFANGVNDFGYAVGDAEDTSTRSSTTEDFCGYQAMGFSFSPVPCVPFVWQNGRMFPLKTLGGVNGVANQINTFGTIAGFAENTTVDPGCTAPQIYQFKPAIWIANFVQALPTGSDPDGTALSVNDLGQAVGTSGSCAPFNPIWLFNLNPAHALLWQNGNATDLGNLGGAFNNMAHQINNLGQVVGGSDVAGDVTTHAFLWTPAKQMQDLGTVNDALDNDSYSFGLGINDKGQIVGISASADFSIIRAFIRENGTLVDLNSLVAGSTTLELMTACSINLEGEIIGIAFDPDTGEIHGYRATPTTGAGWGNPRGPVVLPEWLRARLRSLRRG
jgi:probable HAF family extracellular repeat protein